MNNLMKEKRSRLSPFEEALFAMETRKSPLTEMQAWLAGQGVTITTVGISKFLASRRRHRWQAQLLAQVASGGQPAEEAATALQASPPPELDTLIKLSRILVFEQTSRLVITPELTRQAREMTKMVLTYINRQSRVEFRERSDSLTTRKAAALEPAAYEKPPTSAVEEFKENPDTLELFRSAWAALQAGRQKQSDPQTLNNRE
jgi:hypothetical protein